MMESPKPMNIQLPDRPAMLTGNPQIGRLSTRA